MRRTKIRWFKLMSDMMKMSVEASAVIGLRAAKIAKGDAAAKAEAHRMAAEKVDAAIRTNMDIATSLMTGRAAPGPNQIVGAYRKRVRGNLRRLSKKR
jgi:hypothetical protein